VIVDGEVEAYLLPSGREYTITVERRGEGAIHLDLFRPGADRKGGKRCQAPTFLHSSFQLTLHVGM
jgi:hypothetical protein